MDYSSLIKELDKATSFDLYRLSSAIDRMLDDPVRITHIKQFLRIGQEVEYFDSGANRVVSGTVVRFLPTKVVVENHHDKKCWRLPFYMINIHQIDTKINEGTKQGLGRNEVAVDDLVGFLDRDNHERYGTVIRLNPKTVTLACDGGQWRVAYSFLFKILSPQVKQLAMQQAPEPDNQASRQMEGDKIADDGEPATPASRAVDQGPQQSKIGRNHPCPCGSGKKFKKCCLGR